MPVVPEVVALVTPVPLMSGSLLAEVSEYTTPRSVMVAPPSPVTLPPKVADVPVTLALVGVVTVGAVAGKETLKLSTPAVASEPASSVSFQRIYRY